MTLNLDGNFENPDFFEDLFNGSRDSKYKTSHQFVMEYRQIINNGDTETFINFVNDVYSEKYKCDKSLVLQKLYCIIHHYNLTQRIRSLSEKQIYDDLLRYARTHNKIKIHKNKTRPSIIREKSRYNDAITFINKNLDKINNTKSFIQFIKDVYESKYDTSIDRRYVLRKILFSITTAPFRKKHKISLSGIIDVHECYRKLSIIHEKYPHLVFLNRIKK